MKIQTIVRTATPSVIAAGALLLSARCRMNTDTLIIAYGCVLALAVVVTIEYRIPWKRIFGR